MADKSEKKKKLEGFLKKRHAFQKVYGRPLDEMFQETGQLIPNVVIDCVGFLRDFPDALSTEGIFRISPSIVQIAKVKESFVNAADSVNLFQLTSDVHVVASCLKHFFSELPEPLFPFSMYDSLCRAYDSDNREEELQAIVDSLPTGNRYVLAFLFGFLTEVAALSEVNKMTFQNIAVCFGPNLIRPKLLTPQIMMEKYDSKITQWLLENYDDIVKLDGIDEISQQQKGSKITIKKAKMTASANKKVGVLILYVL